MRHFPTRTRSVRTMSRRLAIDNPFLAAALRCGVVRWPEPSVRLARAESLGLFAGYYLRTSEGTHWIGATLAAARGNLACAHTLFCVQRGADPCDVRLSVGADEAQVTNWLAAPMRVA